MMAVSSVWVKDLKLGLSLPFHFLCNLEEVTEMYMLCDKGKRPSFETTKKALEN
jgi:hypothetical protein